MEHQCGRFTQQAITGDPWNNLNSPIQSSYYDPTRTNIPAGTGSVAVTWIAFPNRLNEYLGQNQTPPNPYNLTQEQLFELADTGFYTQGGKHHPFPRIPESLCPQPDWSGSLHTYGPYGPRGWLDEYCEFSVTRDPKSNKVTRVDIVLRESRILVHAMAREPAGCRADVSRYVELWIATR